MRRPWKVFTGRSAPRRPEVCQEPVETADQVPEMHTRAPGTAHWLTGTAQPPPGMAQVARGVSPRQVPAEALQTVVEDLPAVAEPRCAARRTSTSSLVNLSRGRLLLPPKAAMRPYNGAREPLPRNQEPSCFARRTHPRQRHGVSLLDLERVFMQPASRSAVGNTVPSAGVDAFIPPRFAQKGHSRATWNLSELLGISAGTTAQIGVCGSAGEVDDRRLLATNAGSLWR